MLWGKRCGSASLQCSCLFFPSERPQGASTLADRHAAVRPPSLLPQPQDPWTQLPHPWGKKTFFSIYTTRIQFLCNFKTTKMMYQRVGVFITFLFLSLLELYVWLPRWRLGEAASRWNGQTSLRRCVRDQRCRLPGQDYTHTHTHTHTTYSKVNVSSLQKLKISCCMKELLVWEFIRYMTSFFKMYLQL